MPVAPTTGQKEPSSRYHPLLQKSGHHGQLSPSHLLSGGNHVFPADPQACLQEIRQLATPGQNFPLGLHQQDPYNPSVHPLHLGHTPPGLLAISSMEPHPFQHRSSPSGYDLREVPQRRNHQGLPPPMPHSPQQYSGIRGNDDNHKSESPHRKRRRLSSHNDHSAAPSPPMPLSAWDHMCAPGGDRNMWRRNIPQRRIALERCNNSRCCRSPTNRRNRYRERPNPWHGNYSVDQRNFQPQPVSAQAGGNLHGQMHPHPGLLPHPTSPPQPSSQVQSMQQGFPLDAAQGMSPFQVSMTPPPPLCTSSSHMPLHSSPHFTNCGVPPFGGAGMGGAAAMPAFSCSCCFHQVHSMHPAQQPAPHQYSFLHANTGPHYMPPRFQSQMPPMPSPLGQRSRYIPTPPIVQNPDGDEPLLEHRPYPNLSPMSNHHIPVGYNGSPMAASMPLPQQLQDHGPPMATQPDFFCMSAQQFARRLNQPRHIGSRRWRGPILTAGTPAPPPAAYPGFILHFLAMLSNPSIPYMPEIASPESPEAENYEALLNLAERLGEAKPRGLTKAEIELLPSYRFNPETHESEQTSCVVCMCDFEPRQVLRVLPCGHEFHARCVDKWLKSNRTCPICRGDAAESG